MPRVRARSSPFAPAARVVVPAVRPAYDGRVRLMVRAALIAILLGPSVAAAADTSAARMRVSVQVVRPCQVAAGPDGATVRCAPGTRGAIRVKTDRHSPALLRPDAGGAVSLSSPDARQVTIEF